MNNSSVQGKHFWRIVSAMLLFVQLASSSFFITPVFAAAAPESIISYQGRLLNNNRVPVSSTSASILFELYTAVSGGSCVWSNSSSTCASATARTVTLTDGLFSENLGDTTDADPYAAIGDAVFGNNSTLYLQITVNGETLTPRKHIAAAPYALNAHLLDGLAADNDGSTSSALIALNSSGNLVVTGNPGGSGVANGSLYINPASGDVALDNTLFGVAVDGTERFRVDGEGDTSIGGSLLLAGSALSSSSSTMNVFDDTSGTTRIDIGGVDTDRGNTINIATNNTTADTIIIGNANASTAFTLTGGTAWSVSSLGSATFSDIACTDCLDWTEIADSSVLDATTFIGFGASSKNALIFVNNGSGDMVTNLSSTGDALWVDNGSTFLTLSDAGAYTYALDATDNPDYTITNSGSGNIVTHLNGSGDINFTDNGTPFFTLNDEGGFNLVLDAADSPAYIVTNAGVTDMQTNLNGTGDYIFVDSGVTFLTLSDAGAFSYTLDAVDNPNFTVGNSGTGTIGFNLAGSAGNFRVFDNAVTVLQVDATGAYSFTLDSTDNPTYTITNNGSSNIITNLAGTGDFVIQDNGSTFLTLNDSGESTFTSDTTTGTAFLINANAVATNTGFSLLRADSVATDFDGILFDVEQNRTSAGSDGIVFNLKNMSGGNSPALYITQDQVADATVTPNAQALVIDVNESSNSDEVILIRSDADNSSGLRDTEFRFENDGDAFADGAWTGAGADYAEFFPSADRTLGDFELACWNASQASGVKRCDAGETNIVGVISTNPGFIGNSYSGAETSLENNPNYALVGLVGQIETYVSADAGAIAIGDALTTSSARAGYASRASGGTYIIGRALEPLASGTGTIKVLVQPMWYGGDMLSMNGSATTFMQDIILQGAGATVADTSVDSAGLSFVGSSWNGSAANAVSLTLRNSVLGDGSAQLGLQNDDGIDVMTFGSTGDLALAGNLYPSDRGALQYGAYVYYDSTAAGYMKTNAAGWSSESSSFAESFASADLLVPGDVVEFASDGSGVVRSSGILYSNRIVGVVSSHSAFLAGDTVGTYPIAVSGRVSVKVNDENGIITSGDALTTSSHPGIAMKATSSGQIIGYALESLTSDEGSILAFVRPQYIAFGDSGASHSLAIDAQDIETLNVTGLLSMNGGDIVNVGILSGIGMWEIQENGDIITHGQLTQVVKSLQNTDVSTYSTTSTETLVQLSGSTTLHGGIARVSFDDIDENFNDIISPEAPYRVLVTPDGITGQLYVTDRSNAGFIIHDVNQGEGVSVDWLVLAYRYDIVPSAQHSSPAEEDIQEQILLEEEQGAPLDEGSGGDAVESGVLETQISNDPVPSADPTPAADPVPSADPDSSLDTLSESVAPDPVLNVVPEASPENAP